MTYDKPFAAMTPDERAAVRITYGRMLADSSSSAADLGEMVRFMESGQDYVTDRRLAREYVAVLDEIDGIDAKGIDKAVTVAEGKAADVARRRDAAMKQFDEEAAAAAADVAEAQAAAHHLKQLRDRADAYGRNKILSAAAELARKK